MGTSCVLPAIYQYNLSRKRHAAGAYNERACFCASCTCILGNCARTSDDLAQAADAPLLCVVS